MKDQERQPTGPVRLSLVRSLWYRSRREARDDAEAGRSITMPVNVGAPRSSRCCVASPWPCWCWP